MGNSLLPGLGPGAPLGFGRRRGVTARDSRRSDIERAWIPLRGLLRRRPAGGWHLRSEQLRRDGARWGSEELVPRPTFSTARCAPRGPLWTSLRSPPSQGEAPGLARPPSASRMLRAAARPGCAWSQTRSLWGHAEQALRAGGRDACPPPRGFSRVAGLVVEPAARAARGDVGKGQKEAGAGALQAKRAAPPSPLARPGGPRSPAKRALVLSLGLIAQGVQGRGKNFVGATCQGRFA